MCSALIPGSSMAQIQFQVVILVVWIFKHSVVYGGFLLITQLAAYGGDRGYNHRHQEMTHQENEAQRLNLTLL
ncbi:hypothetical protein L1887_02861 [Cichorium endivia]|nr:hypothetical protein L1887_02861 [Cichorium endivia]